MSLFRIKAAERRSVPRGVATDGPAILSYGFRPFFLGAGLWSVVAMAAWIGALVWGWEPGGRYGAANWHAHEMLFGYVSAAIAGFMLTAIPNWTGQLPVSGRPLGFLALLWLAGRIAMGLPDLIGLQAAIFVEASFLPVLGLVAAREIGAGHNWKNLHVVVALGVLTGANIWFHVSVLQGGDTGYALRLAVFVWLMLISLIGGRLIVSFTHNWLKRKGEGSMPDSFGVFDRITIITTALALGMWVAAPDAAFTGVACAGAACLNGVRLSRWRGFKTVSEPLLFVLHVAYAFLPLGLAAVAASSVGWLSPVSALHLFTVGVVGNMTLAVMTRVSRGQTGRPLAASRTTAIAYIALALAALIRPLADLFPQAYLEVLSLSATLWLLGFGIFVLEYAPILVQQRQPKMRE